MNPPLLQTIFLLFILFRETLRGGVVSELSPPPLVTQHEKITPVHHPNHAIHISADSEPSSFVGNVHTVFGNYLHSSVDLVQPGPVPLHFIRYYDSKRHENTWFGAGTTINYPAWIYGVRSNEHHSHVFAIAEESSGSVMSYVYPTGNYDRKVYTYYVSDKVTHGGLTNTGREEISGRTNQKNCHYKAEFIIRDHGRYTTTDTDWTAFLSDGTKREYYISEMYRSIRPIKREIRPDQNRLHFDTHYRGQFEPENIFCDLIRKIEARDSKGKKTFGSLSIHHSEKNKQIIVEASNGKKAIYTYSHTTRDKSLGFKYGYISEVSSPDQPHTRYTFSPLPESNSSKKVVTQINWPNGRYLRLDYDKSGRVIEQYAPYGKNGAEVTTYKYEYHSKDHCTNVWDGLNRKTVYTYSDCKRLKGIRAFTHKDKLYRRLSFIWGSRRHISHEGRDKSDEGNLLAKVLHDGDDKPILSHCLTYDDDHNVIKDVIYGNLSGKGKGKFAISSKGHAIDSSVEKYTKYSSYSHDKFHLKMSESEDDGPYIKYEYKKGTNLLFAKFTCDKKQKIIAREFYIYDSDAVIEKKIIDDGSTTNPKDLHGVTQRRITYMTPVKGLKGHGIGQPKEIRECYYDPISKKEVLLSRKTFKYTQEGLVKEEAVYDCNNKHCYTLFTTYNKNSLPVEKIDALGRKTIYSYDENFNKIREELIGSQVYMTYEYDTANRLIKESEYHSDGRILTNSYTYDVIGNLTSSTDHFGNTISYKYDDFNRVSQATYPLMKMADGTTQAPTVHKEYDVFNNLIQETDQNGNVKKIEYTARGKPSRITNPDGSTEEFIYNLNGTCATAIHRNGSKTEYSYDPLGRVIEERRIDSQGTLLIAERTTYNAFQKTSSTDPMGVTTHYTYDGAGRLIETLKNGEGKAERTTYHYDTLNRLQTTKKWVDDTSYLAFIHKKDFLDRVLEEREESSDGTLLSLKKYDYDIRGNIIRATSFSSLQDAHTLETEYNTENFPVLIRDAIGNETKITYNLDLVNELGQKVLEKTTTDPLGNKTVEKSDAFHRIVSIERNSSEGDPLSRTEITYDLKGNKTLQKEHVFVDGAPTRTYTIAWSYTSTDQVDVLYEEPKSSDEKKISYTYTKSGLIETITKPDGTQINHAYDPLNRLSTLSSSDGTIEYRYSYDANGNIIQVEDIKANTSYTYSYDAWGKKTKDTFLNALSSTFVYDRLGRITSYTLPSYGSIDYLYQSDHLQTITRKKSTGEELYRHTYSSFDLEGKVLQSELIGSIGAISTRYDSLGRIISSSSPFWSETIPQDGFDKAGNLKALSVTDPIGTVNYSFEYDDLYQLTEERGLFSFQYKNDSLMNRLKKNDSTYTINSLNQLLSDSQTAFTYDKNGNVIGIEGNGTSCLLSYDALDRLIAFEIPGLYRYEYMYDSFHRRLRKKEFTWDSYQYAWAEKNSFNFLFFLQREVGMVTDKGILSQFRVLGLGKGAELGASVAIELNGSTYCPINDHRGNVSALIDIKTKEVSEIYRYSAFGEEQIYGAYGTQYSTSILNNPWRFASKRTDSESGLVFFGRRYYAPPLGRFITPDPVGFSDGPNLYAYVHNSPMVLLDPYGLTAMSNLSAAWTGARAGTYNSFVDPSEMWGRNLQSMYDLGSSILSGDITSYQEAWNAATTEELIQAGVQRAVEFSMMAWDLSGFYSLGKLAIKQGPKLFRAAWSWGKNSLTASKSVIASAAKEPIKDATKHVIEQAAHHINTEVIKPTAGSLVKEGFELNQFHAAAKQLSETAQTNIRILRKWAKSKGWIKQPNSLGRPEKWGTVIEGEFIWNLKIKPMSSMRSGLEAGSNIPRFDAKLGDKLYINPFTSQVGNKQIGTHLPLEHYYF